MANHSINISCELSDGLRYHKAGDFKAAEKIYKRILMDYPFNSDCLHLLGVIANQTKNYAAAIDLIGRAVGINPGKGIDTSGLIHNSDIPGALELGVTFGQVNARVQIMADDDADKSGGNAELKYTTDNMSVWLLGAYLDQGDNQLAAGGNKWNNDKYRNWKIGASYKVIPGLKLKSTMNVTMKAIGIEINKERFRDAILKNIAAKLDGLFADYKIEEFDYVKKESE